MPTGAADPTIAPVYLGIDGGGSKTDACLLDAGGRELGRGAAGPCNASTCSPADLRAALSTAALAARQASGLDGAWRCAAVCVCAAGAGSPATCALLRDILAAIVPGARLRVEPDFVAAHRGAGGGAPGVLVSAGTGAVIFGRSRTGGTARLDGRGYLLGDRGSAFAIGLAALRRAAWSADAGEPLDALARRLLANIGASGPEEISDWLYRDFAPARVAALGGAVASWAGAGDPDALAVVAPPIAELAAGSLAVARRLGMDALGPPYYLCGGVWRAGGPPVVDLFARAVAAGAAGGAADVRLPMHDAAFGAALVALQDMPGDVV